MARKSNPLGELVTCQGALAESRWLAPRSNGAERAAYHAAMGPFLIVGSPDQRQPQARRQAAAIWNSTKSL